VSGTGQHHLTPVEQHLGDRLSAFVDGELRDDARDRVLAHLASCAGCKDAAEEQRRLKNVVAAADPPALSAGFLARLQGLPGGDDDQGQDPFRDDLGGRDTMGSAGLGGERLDGGLFGRFGGPRGGQFPPPFSSGGFRIHEMGPPGRSASRSSSSSPSMSSPSSPVSSRSASPLSPSPVAGPASAGRRGRRLAFAAAGAFSMAAIALGGALPLDSAVDGGAEDPGPAASPLSVNDDASGDADAAARLAGLWRASHGVTAGDPRRRGGVLRSPAPVATSVPASRPLSSRPLAVPGGGDNAWASFGRPTPVPPFPPARTATPHLVAPLLVASAASPPAPGAPKGPATAASTGALAPMTGGGPRDTR
jgi:hypothetical protein